MSGGHFNYQQHRLEDIAQEIDHLIETNDSTELDQWGSEIGFQYPPEIIEKFKLTAKTLRQANAMVHRVDWLVSGDDGDGTFLKAWEEQKNAN